MIKRVKTIPRPIYEVRPSKLFLGDVGNFAIGNIKKGTIIDNIDSPEAVVFLSQKDFKKLDSITRKRIVRFCPNDEDEYCIPADFNNMGSSWFFNHSCSPNMDYDKKGNFVAARNIKKDEELLTDYGRMLTEKNYKMKCSCGAANCRGVITGKDWLDPEFRKNNLDKMWPDLRKLPIGKKA